MPQQADSTLTLTVDTDYRLTARAWQDWYGNRVLTTPSSRDGFYPEGTEVRLLAAAKPPAKFLGWNGDVTGRNRAALVVMDDGKLAEAVFALESKELRHGVPANVSLRSTGNDLDYERFHVRMPANADALDVRFTTRAASPGTEAGLFLTPDHDPWRNQVQHENADLVLRRGVATVTIPRPPAVPRQHGRWPVAYFILIRAAESDRPGSRTLTGTLVASPRRHGSRLTGGQQLSPGQFLRARSGSCRLAFQTDGNLIARSQGRAYWRAPVRGTRGGAAIMRENGNFVLVDARGAARWSTRTGGNRGASLVMQRDCNIVLRSAAGATLWSTGRP